MSQLLFLAQDTVVVSNGGGNAGGILAGVGIVGLIIALLVAVFVIWMLIDCLTSNLPTVEKLVWALVIFFFPLLGAIVYFFVGRRGRVGRAGGM